MSSFHDVNGLRMISNFKAVCKLNTKWNQDSCNIAYLKIFLREGVPPLRCADIVYIKQIHCSSF